MCSNCLNLAVISSHKARWHTNTNLLGCSWKHLKHCWRHYLLVFLFLCMRLNPPTQLGCFIPRKVWNKKASSKSKDIKNMFLMFETRMTGVAPEYNSDLRLLRDPWLISHPCLPFQLPVTANVKYSTAAHRASISVLCRWNLGAQSQPFLHSSGLASVGEKNTFRKYVI